MHRKDALPVYGSAGHGLDAPQPPASRRETAFSGIYSINYTSYGRRGGGRFQLTLIVIPQSVERRRRISAGGAGVLTASSKRGHRA